MNSYISLIILCCAIIFSYIFDIIAKKIKLPAVILLIGTGMAINQYCKFQKINIDIIIKIIPTLGLLGLVLIVLEGSLELELKRENKPIITKSFISSLVLLLLSALTLYLYFTIFLTIPSRVALFNSVVLSVISSAIAIPSVSNWNKKKKEFIIYESTFSDIFGIIFFNFVLSNLIINFSSFVHLTIETVLLIIGSLISTVLVALLLNKIKHKIKFFLIISILALIFAIGKIYHLSTLLMIFIFGLFINNTAVLLPNAFKKYVDEEKLKTEIHILHLLTAEFAFIIRTFFFLSFGLSIDISTLNNPEAYKNAFIIIIIIFVIRFIGLLTISAKNLIPEVFLSPRGLINILLFLSIPEDIVGLGLGKDVILLVIVGSLIMMTIGNLIIKKDKISFQDQNKFLEESDFIDQIFRIETHEK